MYNILPYVPGLTQSALSRDPPPPAVGPFGTNIPWVSEADLLAAPAAPSSNYRERVLPFLRLLTGGGEEILTVIVSPFCWLVITRCVLGYEGVLRRGLAGAASTIELQLSASSPEAMLEVITRLVLPPLSEEVRLGDICLSDSKFRHVELEPGRRGKRNLLLTRYDDRLADFVTRSVEDLLKGNLEHKLLRPLETVVQIQEQGPDRRSLVFKIVVRCLATGAFELDFVTPRRLGHDRVDVIDPKKTRALSGVLQAVYRHVDMCYGFKLDQVVVAALLRN